MSLSTAEREAIDRFIEARGVTRCPPRFSGASEHACAPLPPEPRRVPDARAEEARLAWTLYVVERLPMSEVALRLGRSEIHAYRLTNRHASRSASAKQALARRLEDVRQQQYAAWLEKHRKPVAAPPATSHEDRAAVAGRLLADGYAPRQVSTMTGISMQRLAAMRTGSGRQG